MARIKVDTTTSKVMAMDASARPALAYEGEGDNRHKTGQAVNEAGVPLWTVSLLLADAESADKIRVKFAEDVAVPPQFVVMGQVIVRGLVATVVKENIYYSATSVAPAKATA